MVKIEGAYSDNAASAAPTSLKTRFEAPCLLALLTLAWPHPVLADPASSRWESPFQAGKPDVVKNKLRPVPTQRCDHDPYNKCTFTAGVDYDGDGAMDLTRMVDGRSTSALIVEFAGRPRRPPMTIASFNGRWTGSCYIAPDVTDRTAVAFTCPEASAAIFKMRNGKPAVQWIGD